MNVAGILGQGVGPAMALNGQLEDLPIVDIVQVVALSRRSGRLRVENGAGQEAVIGFRDGRIVSARTWETPPLASQTLPATPEEREGLMRFRIREALRLLLSLEAGRFEFQAEDEPAPGASRPHFEELREGLDAQGTLLELLKQADESAARATPQASAPPRERVDLGDGRMVAEFKRRLEAVLIADPASRYAVGIAYKGMGMLDDAIRELERATHDPRYALQGASMLGLCHLEKGDANEAIRWLEKGLALPERSEHEYQGLRVLLAVAYAAAGRVTDALALYEEFGRHGVWIADLAEAMRDLRAASPGAQVLPFTRTAS
jgi:tetratricopeptide (TPR) repeat protein